MKIQKQANLETEWSGFSGKGRENMKGRQSPNYQTKPVTLSLWAVYKATRGLLTGLTPPTSSYPTPPYTLPNRNLVISLPITDDSVQNRRQNPHSRSQPPRAPVETSLHTSQPRILQWHQAERRGKEGLSAALTVQRAWILDGWSPPIFPSCGPLPASTTVLLNPGSWTPHVILYFLSDWPYPGRQPLKFMCYHWGYF